jgi:nitrous oxidase accessory protein NosD
VLAAGAALVAVAPGASGVAATSVDCSTTDLQTAIDNAAHGGTLAVSGICSGNYTIGKNLTRVGRGTAVLDGQQGGTVLTVSSGATVGLSQMAITATLEGGGINNSTGTTTLNYSAVTNNTALLDVSGSYGGGIYDFSGIVPLKSSVSSNNPDNCDQPGNVSACAG